MKLKSKIYVIIFINIVISTILFGLIYFPYQREFSESILEKDKLLLKTLVERDENPIANELYDRSSKAMIIRLDEMKKVKGIMSITVFDATGAVFLKTDNLNNHEHLHLIRHEVDQLTDTVDKDVFVITEIGHHTVLRYTHEIRVVGERIGFIRIYYSLDDIEAQNKRVFYLLGSFLLGMILLFSILINYSISKIVLGPVVALRDLMLKIRSGDFKQRMTIHYNDEIGELADAFNSMSNELNQSYFEIKKQHREIFDMKLYLKSIIDSMSSLVIAVDENTKVTELNQAALDHIDVAYEDVIGHKVCDYIPFFLGYRVDVLEVLKSREPISHREVRLNNELSKYYNIFIYPLMKGAIKGAVILIDDISELHKKDEQLKQAQKMETIGTLAGGIAHDFNNILAGIVGTASILKFSIEKKRMDESLLVNSIGTIERSADRATELVKQLLAVSKKQDLSLKQMDINESLRNMVNICQNSFDKSVEIMAVYSEEAALVDADPSQIEQVFLNICLNASHSMTLMREKETWGGTLLIKSHKVYADDTFKINHHEAENISYWCVSISDTGVGIGADVIDKIFDPFFTTKQHGVGTGLGLSMTYRTIRQHKGFIEVSSEKDKGSTFKIYLPESRHSEKFIEDIDVSHQDLASGDGTVLVVDDEMIVRETAKAILEEFGYTVLLAKDGEEGVRVFEENKDRITAVLLDLIMPKMHGHDVFKEMKAIDPNVKVLMASGFINDERAVQALNMGVKGFIQKPYTLEVLSTEIYNIIHEK